MRIPAKFFREAVLGGTARKTPTSDPAQSSEVAPSSEPEDTVEREVAVEPQNNEQARNKPGRKRQRIDTPAVKVSLPSSHEILSYEQLLAPLPDASERAQSSVHEAIVVGGAAVEPNAAPTSWVSKMERIMIEHGCSAEDLARATMVLSHNRQWRFCEDAAKQLAEYLDLGREFGVSHLIAWLGKMPLVAFKPPAALRGCLHEIMESLSLSAPQSAALVSRYPYLLNKKWTTAVSLRHLCTQLGLSREQAVRVACKRPDVLCITPQKLAAIVRGLTEVLGLKNGSSARPTHPPSTQDLASQRSSSPACEPRTTQDASTSQTRTRADHGSTITEPHRTQDASTKEPGTVVNHGCTNQDPCRTQNASTAEAGAIAHCGSTFLEPHRTQDGSTMEATTKTQQSGILRHPHRTPHANISEDGDTAQLTSNVASQHTSPSDHLPHMQSSPHSPGPGMARTECYRDLPTDGTSALPQRMQHVSSSEDRGIVHDASMVPSEGRSSSDHLPGVQSRLFSPESSSPQYDHYKGLPIDGNNTGSACVQDTPIGASTDTTLPSNIGTRDRTSSDKLSDGLSEGRSLPDRSQQTGDEDGDVMNTSRGQEDASVPPSVSGREVQMSRADERNGTMSINCQLSLRAQQAIMVNPTLLLSNPVTAVQRWRALADALTAVPNWRAEMFNSAPIRLSKLLRVSQAGLNRLRFLASRGHSDGRSAVTVVCISQQRWAELYPTYPAWLAADMAGRADEVQHKRGSKAGLCGGDNVASPTRTREANAPPGHQSAITSATLDNATCEVQCGPNSNSFMAMEGKEDMDEDRDDLLATYDNEQHMDLEQQSDDAEFDY